MMISIITSSFEEAFLSRTIKSKDSHKMVKIIKKNPQQTILGLLDIVQSFPLLSYCIVSPIYISPICNVEIRFIILWK